MQLVCARGTCQVWLPSRILRNAKASKKASDGGFMLLCGSLDIHVRLNNKRAKVKAA